MCSGQTLNETPNERAPTAAGVFRLSHNLFRDFPAPVKIYYDFTEPGDSFQ